MSFRDKYDPADHDGDDIYVCVYDEAMLYLLQPDAEPTKAAVARYVVGRLALDPEDLPLIEQLVVSAIDNVQDPEIVANWRAVRAARLRGDLP